MQEAYSFLQQHFSFTEGENIVVAVSGGPDSMALLHLLSLLQTEKKIQVVCAHVNHNVRKESEAEKEFVKDFCHKNNILFAYMKIENYGDDNFHNEARHIRYQFFQKILTKYHARYLFTAHHGDDLMETILMRMVRGSTLKGYGGFSKIVDRDSYQIVRPFINLTKQDILKYNEENQIPFVLDSSNDKDVYTRNRFRKYIVSNLKKEDKDVHQKFYKYSQTILEASAYIEKMIALKIPLICTQNQINIDKYLKEEAFVQKQILYHFLEKFYEDDILLVTDKHIHLLHQFICSDKASGTLYLPHGYLAIKSYQKLLFTKEQLQEEGYEIEIEDKVLLPNGHTLTKMETSNDTSNFTSRFASEQVTFPLYVRTRKDGDKMSIKGMQGTKKISDIFINEKIDLKERQMYPIVTDATGQIIWIPGLKKSQFDKSKEEKYDIILKYD